jgi:predicted ATP-grasp superfamily ATP-dependent carboligase
VSKFLEEFQEIHRQSQLEDDNVINEFPQLSPRRTAYDALVLEARLRQSLVTIRSLGSRGMNVAALETFGGVPAFSSRWCQQVFIFPHDENAEAYLTSLEQLIEQTRIGVLIISTDADVALIRLHREHLEKRVRIALAKEPALGIALSKEQTLAVARSLGIATPRSVTVKSAGEVESALGEVGLPAVIKPIQSWAWREQRSVGLASKLVTTSEEARSAIEELSNLGVAALFQQFLPGRREAVSFIYANNQIYARFAQWAKRTDPPLGGTSVLRQSIPIPPDIGDKAERLVREIELEGYSEVEFRRGSDGTPYLMEINPRLSASVEIAVHAGVDFPYLLYQWASGGKIDVVQGYQIGKWMRHLGGDVMTTIAAIRERDRPGVASPKKVILDFCATFFVPMRYDYLDLRDPLPAWIAAFGFTRFLLQGMTRKLLRRKPGSK